MKKLGRKLVAALMGVMLLFGSAPSAWASEDQSPIIAERSFQQISRTAPLITVRSPASSDAIVPNVQVVGSVEEQRAAMGLENGLSFDFEVDSADIKETLRQSLNTFTELREPKNAASVTSELLHVQPDIHYGPFSISAARSQDLIVEVNKPSMLSFVLGKRSSSNKEDSVHVVLSDEDGDVNSEWDIDRAVESHTYGGFFLEEGTWTIRLSTPASVDDVRFYYLLAETSQEKAYESEQNSSIETADDVPLNQVFTGLTYDPSGEVYLLGSFMPIVDVDILRFTLNEASHVEIDLATLGKLSYQVYDEDGKPLRPSASKNESDPYISGVTPANKENERQIDCGTLPAGIYYMHITGMDSDVWKKTYSLSVLAVAAEVSDPAPSNPPSSEETRNVTISVRDGHGTTNPVPGTYKIARSDSFIVNFAPDDGYVLSGVWVNGAAAPTKPEYVAWNLPASSEDQTIEIKYEIQGSDVGGDYRDISKTTIYINGLPVSNAPRLQYNGNKVEPNITAVHHIGTGTFKRLCPEGIEIGSTATYHFSDKGIEYTRVVVFPAGGGSCIISDECKLGDADEAEYFAQNIQAQIPDEYLDSWSAGNIAYVQFRLSSPAANKEAFDSIMKKQYGASENHLVLGPNAGTEYEVSFADNDKLGTCTVRVTGTGSHYGTKTATFELVGSGTNGDESNRPNGIESGFRDISSAEMYINGAPSAEGLQVSYNGNKIEPNAVVVHHNGTGTFKRIYPDGFDLREIAVYHYRLSNSDVTTVVAFEDGRESCIYNTEMTFPYEWMAEEFVARARNELKAGEFLDGWSVGNAAYIQQRLASNDRTACDITMVNNYATSGLVIGPDDGFDYTIAYENNDKPGTATVIATGTRDCFGTKSATFTIIGGGSDGNGTGIPGDAQAGTTNRTNTTTPLVQTGASTANGSSSGKTGLVQTGDVVGYSAAGASVLAILAALVIVGRKRKHASVATGPQKGEASFDLANADFETKRKAFYHDKLDKMIPKL